MYGILRVEIHTYTYLSTLIPYHASNSWLVYYYVLIPIPFSVSLITAPGGCLCLEKHDGSDCGWIVRIVVASDSICRVTPPVAAYASGGGKGMRGKGIGRSVGQACFAYPDLGFTSKTTRSSWTYVLLSRLEATSLAKAGSTIMKKRSKGRGRPQQVSNPTRY